MRPSPAGARSDASATPAPGPSVVAIVGPPGAVASGGGGDWLVVAGGGVVALPGTGVEVGKANGAALAVGVGPGGPGALVGLGVGRVCAEPTTDGVGAGAVPELATEVPAGPDADAAGGVEFAGTARAVGAVADA